MHEDYLEDAIPVPVSSGMIEVHVLGPVDLVVSKIARFAGPDTEDIASIIARCGLSGAQIEQRAEEALGS